MTDRQANVKLRSYQTSDCMDINLYKNHHLILVTKRWLRYKIYFCLFLICLLIRLICCSSNKRIKSQIAI